MRWYKLTPEGADFLPGFSPWMALAFAGTLLFSRGRFLWLIPVAIIGIDQISFGFDGASLKAALPTYACLALAAWWASTLHSKVGIFGILGRAVVGTVGFYVVTNSASWLTNPIYAKSVEGWIQALTVGMPGYPASILFFRNALLSDLAFSIVLIAAYNMEAAKLGAFKLPLRGSQPATA